MVKKCYKIVLQNFLAPKKCDIIDFITFFSKNLTIVLLCNKLVKKHKHKKGNKMKLAHKSSSKKITGVEVIRNCYNLSQTQIGNITGYSQRQVSRVETHKSTMPAPMRKLLDILVVYNATLKKLNDANDDNSSGDYKQHYEVLLKRLHDILTNKYASTKNEIE